MLLCFFDGSDSTQLTNTPRQQTVIYHYIIAIFLLNDVYSM